MLVPVVSLAVNRKTDSLLLSLGIYVGAATDPSTLAVIGRSWGR